MYLYALSSARKLVMSAMITVTKLVSSLYAGYKNQDQPSAQAARNPPLIHSLTPHPLLDRPGSPFNRADSPRCTVTHPHVAKLDVARIDRLIDPPLMSF